VPLGAGRELWLWPSPGVYCGASSDRSSNATNRAHNVDFRFRTHAEVARFFDGLELVDPGIVPVAEWRSGDDPTPERANSNIWAGLARKP
jgi:hypothetical protein